MTMPQNAAGARLRARRALADLYAVRTVIEAEAAALHLLRVARRDHPEDDGHVLAVLDGLIEAITDQRGADPR